LCIQRSQPVVLCRYKYICYIITRDF
jgi:hypothetical protein